MSSRRSWRLLLGTWGVYWALLAAFTIGPLALAAYRATRGPDDQTSSVNVSFGNDGFAVTVIRHGQTTYTAAASLLSIVLWIAGPPLLAWLAFAIRGRREERAAERV